MTGRHRSLGVVCPDGRPGVVDAHHLAGHRRGKLDLDYVIGGAAAYIPNEQERLPRTGAPIRS
jgi:hypothetical protein